MRRILIAIFGTVFGTTLLVGLKFQGVTTPVAADGTTPQDPGTGAGTGGPPAPGQTTKPGTSPKPGTTTSPKPGQTTTKPGQSTSTTKPPTRTTTTSAPPASKTITGTAFAASGFGNMQVRITVTGTDITAISTIQVSNRPKSTVSLLTNPAINADGVPGIACKGTGATYSCDAWKSSLQSAIAQI